MSSPLVKCYQSLCIAGIECVAFVIGNTDVTDVTSVDTRELYNTDTLIDSHT